MEGAGPVNYSPKKEKGGCTKEGFPYQPQCDGAKSPPFLSSSAPYSTSECFVGFNGGEFEYVATLTGW